MTTSSRQGEASLAEAGKGRLPYRGEVVYIFAYDLAYEMDRRPLRELLGQPVAQFSVDASKRSPRHTFLHKPQMVRLPPQERIGPQGPVRVESVVKLLPVGAMSITVRVPFCLGSIEDLVTYHDLQFSNGFLYDDVQKLAEEIRAELGPLLVRPARTLVDEEAYTVFCLEGPMSEGGKVVGAEEWLQSHRRQVAALLTQETDSGHLSRQEANESTARYLSYYGDDLVVIDWDAALLIDEKPEFEETLYILELANLQLAELEAYDRLLDDALERSYRDLGEHPMRSRVQTMRDLREIRIDLARFSDELSNITKFFGDWHLARIYETIAGRFHLADWRRALDEKLKTLDDLYQILKHDQTNRWMMILEVTIVLLFVIDLVILLMGMKH